MVREAAHALKCMLKHNCSELAGQMLSSGMIEYLLKLLGDDMQGSCSTTCNQDCQFNLILRSIGFSNFAGVDNPAAAKAEIVDGLKNVCLDLQYGEKISLMLNKSPIWAQYRDQRHDLFLPVSRTQAIGGEDSFFSSCLKFFII